ncbi:MAG: hypothetical protein HY000_05630 [Planctomycetes bacterium]|nr:hypothetical protein [Planctomycetota bacterium]
MRLETNAAEDGPAYLVEREEKLSQLTCAAALVDQHHASGMRSLRWDLLPARLRPGILHAKVSLLLWSAQVRLIVASANVTELGYRRNHEVFSVLDYFDGSESPLEVLDELSNFLREAVRLTEVGAERENRPAVTRWLEFLDRVSAATRTWGVSEPPRSLTKPRVVAVLTGPGRPDAFTSLRELWPDGSPPDRAFVVSPFFDPPDAPNEPARQLWNLLKQRGAASVEYNVPAEDVPGEKALLLHAPESLIAAQPVSRTQLETTVQRLKLEDGRPLHAKWLWLESDRLILYLAGSSNFTSAGFGLGAVQNIEANLGFIVGQQTGDARKAILNAWLPVERIPDDIKLRWQPREDEGEDAPTKGLLLLPAGFADATFGSDANHGGYVTFTFTSAPPDDWALFPEEEDTPVVTAASSQLREYPATLRIPWSRPRPPSGFRVSWRESGGFAWWPVNVLSGDALPPPDELKDLPLDVLIEVLTSAKPLHLALARWLKRNPNAGPATGTIPLDPHKRGDWSAFLLQRTRRVSWALSALRQRLEMPVVSEQALAWRLRGPVGVLALAQAIGKEARSEPERCFLLTELCLELARVRPQEAAGSLSKARIRAALKELIREIRAGVSSDALLGEPALAAYGKTVFEEVLV